ncbi:MAG: hypothetical protein ICV73_15875, partial [Acetobacteraceae bacterium]|nr:hypothetical protein [Acetobacteraceae bacterium]
MNVISPKPAHVCRGTPSLADVADAARAWRVRNPTRERDMLSALNVVGRMLGLPLSAIPCDIAWLNERLFRQPPQAFGMEQGTFRTVVSNFRAVLRRFGVLLPQARGEADLPPEWLAMLGVIDSEPRRACLRGVARHFAARGIHPGEVTDGAFADFLAHERGTRLAAIGAERGTTLARAWNDVAAAAPATLGALHRLNAPARREPYTLPFEAYPPSLQADIARFAARLRRTSGAALLGRDDGRRSKAATVKARLFDVRQALAALVRQGHDPAAFTGLHDLVQPIENAGKILDFFHERAVARLPPEEAEDAPVAGHQLARIASTLLVIGKRHVGLAGEPLRQLQAWYKAARPPCGRGLTGKTRERLRRLIEPHARSRLLVLPEDVHEAAREDGALDIDTARRVMLATAIEILLVCPLRMRNLAALRLDRHLPRTGHGGRRITRLVLDGGETKNDEPVEWPVPEASTELLEAWIRTWRPLLLAGGGDTANPYLFPGRRAGAPASQSALANGLAALIRREVGVVAHPHLMRH